MSSVRSHTILVCSDGAYRRGIVNLLHVKMVICQERV